MGKISLTKLCAAVSNPAEVRRHVTVRRRFHVKHYRLPKDNIKVNIAVKITDEKSVYEW